MHDIDVRDSKKWLFDFSLITQIVKEKLLRNGEMAVCVIVYVEDTWEMRF